MPTEDPPPYRPAPPAPTGRVYGGGAGTQGRRAPAPQNRTLPVAAGVAALGLLAGAVMAFGACADRGPAQTTLAGQPATTVAAPTLSVSSAPAPTATTTPTPTATEATSAPPPAQPQVRTLHSVSSTLCLDVAPAADPEGAAVVQAGCGGAPTQQWRLTPAGDALTLTNVASGKCLDVQNGGGDDMAPVLQVGCGGQPSQQWRATPAGDNAVALVNVASGKCLDVPELSTESGVPLQQFGCNNGGNQRWSVTP